MTQPFVLSMKLTADGSDAVRGVREVRNEIDILAKKATSAPSLSAELDRMFGIGGNAPLKATIADIDSMGQQLDVLRAQYNPVFAAEQAHQSNLAGIQRAYGLGAISADEMTAAIDREKMAHTSAIATLDGHTGAMMRNNRAAAQRTNLLFQLQDIGVSLASGMNPLMVAAQQGSQISMIYGPDEGGLGKALSETGKMAGGLLSKIGPLALAIGAGSLAIAGLRHEIEETSGVSVGFGDVLAATFQVPANAIYEYLKPALDDLAGWWSNEWDIFVQQTREGGNFLVRESIGAWEIIKASVLSIPDVFVVVGEDAANGFLRGIEQMVRGAMEQINGLFKGLNDFTSQWDMEPIKLFDPETVKLGEVKMAEEARARLAAGWTELGATLDGIAARDYMGEFFGAVQQQAVQNYNAGLEDTNANLKNTAAAAVNAASGVDLAKEAMAAFNEEIDFYKSTFTGFVTDMFKGLREGGNAWDVFADAATSALDRIADRAIGASSDDRFDWYGWEPAA